MTMLRTHDYATSELPNDSAIAGASAKDALETLQAEIGAIVGGVSSVFARTGAVVALPGDYTGTEITNNSTVAGASVTNALDWLQTQINNLFASAIGNDSSVSGSTVKDALNALLAAIAALVTGVSSVYGRTGAVVAAAGDYAASQVNNDSSEAGAHVSDALTNLKNAIAALVTGVSSVYGRTGAVVAAAGDYAASQVNNDSAVTGTHVSDALNTLNSSISSSPVSEAWALPASPSTYDDEFTSDTSANYVWYDSNGSTVITPSGTIDPYATITTGVVQQIQTPRRSWLAAQIRNTNVNTFLTKPWTPDTNDFVWTRLAHAGRPAVVAGDISFGLNLMAATGGHPDPANTVEIALVSNSGNGNFATRLISDKNVANVNTTILAGGTYATNSIMLSTYLGIQKRGTTYDFWALDAQGRLYWWGTTTHSSTMAYLAWRMVDNTSTGTKPGNPIFYIDFIRVQQNTAVFLP